MTLPTDYQTFIHLSKYARWLDELKRREVWTETGTRYMEFMRDHLLEKHNYTIPAALYKKLYSAIINLEIMPSMRAMHTAGPALARCNVGAFNCAYLPVDHPRAFDECLYILMNSTGVGYSVEASLISKLPIVNEHFEDTETTIIVQDSKAGWARGLRELLSMLWAGQVPQWDTSRVRKKGSRLKTFGGRASGPEPLIELFEFCVATFKAAAGRRLTSIECHDIMCKIGTIVEVGGVRRAALICLSDIDDYQMRHAKSGEWSLQFPYRSMANISAAHDHRPDIGTFFREWMALYESKSGERGIFNRQAAIDQVLKTARRDPDHMFGTNPCSEIILRPYQFCNLTEVVVRAGDSVADVERKVELAAILGTFQSTLTDFKYLRKVWKNNTEGERLLGVSLTGVMDNTGFNGKGGLNALASDLTYLKDTAVSTNKKYAELVGISQSMAVTCNKPSGTVSQLVNASEGMHSRHSAYYIRTVRGDLKDPLTRCMMDQGVPHEPCASKPADMVVFSFPISSPRGAVTRNDRTAIEQLNIWKCYQDNWCEHKPSCTVSVREEEWPAVCAWVWEHFDSISGVSFLPYDGGTYVQAPYQEIDRAEYLALKKEFPKQIDWNKLGEYETEDNTTGAQELACSGGVCDVVDIAS